MYVPKKNYVCDAFVCFLAITPFLLSGNYRRKDKTDKKYKIKEGTKILTINFCSCI